MFSTRRQTSLGVGLFFLSFVRPGEMGGSTLSLQEHSDSLIFKESGLRKEGKQHKIGVLSATASLREFERKKRHRGSSQRRHCFESMGPDLQSEGRECLSTWDTFAWKRLSSRSIAQISHYLLEQAKNDPTFPLIPLEELENEESAARAKRVLVNYLRADPFKVRVVDALERPLSLKNTKSEPEEPSANSWEEGLGVLLLLDRRLPEAIWPDLKAQEKLKLLEKELEESVDRLKKGQDPGLVSIEEKSVTPFVARAFHRWVTARGDFYLKDSRANAHHVEAQPPWELQEQLLNHSNESASFLSSPLGLLEELFYADSTPAPSKSSNKSSHEIELYNDLFNFYALSALAYCDGVGESVLPQEKEFGELEENAKKRSLISTASQGLKLNKGFRSLQVERDLQKIEGLNRVLFFEQKIRFPHRNTHARELSRHSDQRSVLERREGVCLGVSLLYYDLARRLDLDLTMVTPPGHIYLRYEGSRERRGDGKQQSIDEGERNIETTAFGAHFPTRHYAPSIKTPLFGSMGQLRCVGPGDVERMLWINCASKDLTSGHPKKALKAYDFALKALPSRKQGQEEVLEIDSLAEIDRAQILQQRLFCALLAHLPHESYLEAIKEHQRFLIVHHPTPIKPSVPFLAPGGQALVSNTLLITQDLLEGRIDVSEARALAKVFLGDTATQPELIEEQLRLLEQSKDAWRSLKEGLWRGLGRKSETQPQKAPRSLLMAKIVLLERLSWMEEDAYHQMMLSHLQKLIYETGTSWRDFPKEALQICDLAHNLCAYEEERFLLSSIASLEIPHAWLERTALSAKLITSPSDLLTIGEPYVPLEALPFFYLRKQKLEQLLFDPRPL